MLGDGRAGGVSCTAPVDLEIGRGYLCATVCDWKILSPIAPLREVSTWTDARPCEGGTEPRVAKTSVKRNLYF